MKSKYAWGTFRGVFVKYIISILVTKTFIMCLISFYIIPQDIFFVYFIFTLIVFIAIEIVIFLVIIDYKIAHCIICDEEKPVSSYVVCKECGDRYLQEKMRDVLSKEN